MPPGLGFDAASNSGYQAAQSSYSWNHAWAGANPFIAVDVSLLSVAATVSSVTFNGQGLELIVVRSTVTAFGRIECWGASAVQLANLGNGTYSIAVTLTSSIASAAVAVSYHDVNQDTPTEGPNSNQATNVGAADATVDITMVSAGCWIHAAVATDDGSVTAAQTTRNNVTGAGGSSADEDTNLGSPGVTTMNYTNVGALATWAMGGYCIRPATDADLFLPRAPRVLAFAAKNSACYY